MGNFVKKKEPRHDLSESSSSVETEVSKPPKDALELGIHMVQELGLQQSSDTLSRWMVHHLAELMTASEKAVSPEEQTKATEAAANLILKVWEHRANLPGNVNPMNSFSGVLRVLN